MLDAPLASGDLAGWGEPGRGRWITVYANPGHVYMEVGGLRFDTSGRAGRAARDGRTPGAQAAGSRPVTGPAFRGRGRIFESLRPATAAMWTATTTAAIDAPAAVSA